MHLGVSRQSFVLSVFSSAHWVGVADELVATEIVTLLVLEEAPSVPRSTESLLVLLLGGLLPSSDFLSQISAVNAFCNV